MHSSPQTFSLPLQDRGIDFVHPTSPFWWDFTGHVVVFVVVDDYANCNEK